MWFIEGYMVEVNKTHLPHFIFLRYPAVIVHLVQTNSYHRGEDILYHPVTDPLAE